MFKLLIVGVLSVGGVFTGLALSPEAPVMPVAVEKCECCRGCDSVADIIQLATVHVRAGSREGSGFLYKSRGEWFVFTCYHVISRADQAEVTFATGQVLPGHVVAVDPQGDIGVLLLASVPAGVRSLEFSPRLANLGDEVLCAGCPFGLEGQGTISSGIVSFLGRRWAAFSVGPSREINGTFDQVSAPTFPGSSGGVVVLRETGEVIGIVSGGSGETFTLIVPGWRLQSFFRRSFFRS